MEELYPLESTWIVAACAGAVLILMWYDLRRATLPLQNILMITICIFAAEAALDHFLANYARVELAGPRWHYLGGAALLWTAVVLTCRRITKFIIRPWRNEKVYGLWLLGMSTVFVFLFQFGWTAVNFDPENDPLPPDKALIIAGIRAGVALVLLTCLFPFFIRKRPLRRKVKADSPTPQQPQQHAQ